MKRIVTLIFILMFLGIGRTTSAFDIGDIMIHGFVSQGYLKSSDNNFLGNSEEGSYEFNEFGINLSVPITDELRFGSQLFSRDVGEYGNNDLTVDWAFLAYERQDWLKFRAGKVKMPYGLYNGKRDADMLRTSVLLPQTVYPEGTREFLVAFNGAGLSGMLDFKSAGILDYEVFTGTMNIENDNTFIANMGQLLTMDLTSQGIDFQAILAATGADFSDSYIDIHHMEGGQLIWNLPVNGLRLGGTYIQWTGAISSGTLNMDISMDINALSAEYEIGPVLMAAEYMALDGEMEIPSLEPYSFDMEGWYGSLSWRINKWLALGASYGEYYPISDDKDGDLFVSVGLRDYYAWQKDTAFSLRFDITDHWLVKLETHFMNGVALTDISNNPDIMEEHWNLYAIKTSLNF